MGRSAFLRRILRFHSASFFSGMGLALVVVSTTFVSVHDASSAKATQWPFDPSGYYYVKEKLPEQLEDFDHVTLMSAVALMLRREEAGALPRSGVYTAKGEVYEFNALKYWDMKMKFEFVTATVNGVSYKFDGEFLNNHIFEEYVTDPKEIVARGTLLKLKDGKTVAEVSTQFTYSAKPRDMTTDVNAKYPSGKTDLMYAVKKGDIVKVRTLLAEGANVNAREPDGSTALIYALRSGRNVDVVEEFVITLIAAGANVNIADKSGGTALIHAAYTRGRLIKVILAAGADPNARDEDGCTALIHVAWSADLGSVDDVKALIRAGADVNIRDKWGRTALSIARETRREEIASALKQAGAKQQRLKKRGR